jgi:hypothetical protein
MMRSHATALTDFGLDGGGLVTFNAYSPDDLALAVKI